ncbi:MAG: hypothetical protein DMG49_13300 [Acidobacteria bacterium]|nr:MAG: hypothetical protein DMG49_13300 [Acidobacteriota bacterium]
MIFPNLWKKIGLSLLTWSVLGVALLFSAPMWAQVTGATLSRTVTDQSGAAVPNAQLNVTNVGKKETHSVPIDADGFYTVPNLVPGTYDVKVSAAGFSTKVQSGIELTVGSKQVLDVTMAVGQITETIEVTGEAPTVELQSSAVGNVVNSATVVELPLNGRDWSQLATLETGVNTLQTQTTTGFTAPRGNRGWGKQLTISGTRPQMNNYRLDGISIVDYAGGSPGSVLAISLGVDAIAEFSVITSNYSAEYGRTSGGIHGDAYWFIRDEGFDSRGFFDTTSLPPFHRNQFGVSEGGPVLKDKTFFFANYEGFRQALGVTNADKVPSLNARNGILAGAGPPLASCPAGQSLIQPGVSNTCIYNVILPYVKIWPLPNGGPIGNGDTAHFDIVATQTGVENFETARIDHRFFDKDSLFGTWFLDKATVSQPDNLVTLLLGNVSTRLMFTAEETHAFTGRTSDLGDEVMRWPSFDLNGVPRNLQSVR